MAMQNGAVIILAIILAMLVGGEKVQAQSVPTCDALTLLGNAVAQKVCTQWSPPNQNLSVCRFNNPESPRDVHSTFNNTTALHITVREGTSEGKSNLTGRWPQTTHLRLEIAASQPHLINGTYIQQFVDILNKVKMSQDQSQLNCKYAWTQNTATIDPTYVTGYVSKCQQYNCN